MAFNLQHKKILFISSKIYGYENYIKQEIESLGALVDFIPERPYNLLYRILRNLNHRLFEKYCNYYLNNIISRTKQITFDYILIIHGVILSREFIHKLRENNSDAKMIMYQWDSNKINPYIHLVDLFDICYSFDRGDCNKFRDITYLPLFFIKDYENLRSNETSRNKTIFDLLIVGTLHDERYDAIQRIKTLCEQNNISIYYYLYMPFLSFIKALFKGKKYKNVKFKILKLDKLLKLYNESSVILDIPRNGQDGLTLRTFEVLGSGKKLLTTNKNILKEPFFDIQRISILDIDNNSIDINFIKNSHNLEWNTVLDTYSLRNWIKTLLGISK